MHQAKSAIHMLTDTAQNTAASMSQMASIIAAQAGEHGAGFLVVAEEIKALSAKTAGSTREIAAVISEVRRRAARTIEVAESSLGVVREEAERVTESSETLVVQSVATLGQVSARNRESARVLASAVDDAVARIGTLAAAVDEIESGRGTDQSPN